ELLLEAGAVGHERCLALLELPPDFLLAAAEMPELRLHPFQALRCRFLVGTAVLELDRDLVCRVAILLGAEAHSLQLLAQLVALAFERRPPGVELLQGLARLRHAAPGLTDLFLRGEPFLLDGV